MIRVHSLLASAAFAAFAFAGLAARADDQGKVGIGTFVASGTKVTAEIGTPYFEANDQDDFVFDGYAGQTVTVSVVAAKGSTLIPSLTLIRPDTSAIDFVDGAKLTPKLGQLPGKSTSVTYKLNQTGVWTIRVQGSFPATGINPQSKRPVYDFQQPRFKGEYVLSVKYGAPPATTFTNAAPDDNGVYNFPLPGSGSALLNATLKFKGGTPTFDAFRDASGTLIPGVVPAVKAGKSLTVKNFTIPAGLPPGAFVMSFVKHPTTAATKVTMKATLKLPKGAAALKGKFARIEPYINTIDRSRGGPGTKVLIDASGLMDPAVTDTSKIQVRLGRYPMTDITLQTATKVFATAPANLPQGTFDLIVTSTMGQATVRQAAFSRAAPPVALAIDPEVASAAGGFPVRITGSGFKPGQNTMRIGYRSVTGGSDFFPGSVITATESEITYRFPTDGDTGLVAGKYHVIVEDTETGLTDLVPMTLDLTQTAAINRVTPGLVPVMGGDVVYINGTNFDPTNGVYLEDAPGSGTYTEITSTQVTFVNAGLHQFVAPARSKGVYRVKIGDSQGYETPTRSFAYYSLADFTATMGLPSAGDGFDAWSTFLADYDSDGDLDLVLSRKGGATLAFSSETRVLRNAGNGSFTDVTATVMPAIKSDDDWRADRVWVADIDPPTGNLKAYPDLVLVTSSTTFPPKDARSHVRILMNERKAGSLDQSERQFVDRTTDLMAPIRSMSTLYGGGGGQNHKDDWRGKDLWVGDLDLSNTYGNAVPPEILITNDERFENIYVSCNPYCASPYSGGYTYNFYWGGTRMFQWDQSARSGLGRYKYDANFFPRKSGVTVAIFNPPPGVTIPTCNGNSCRDKVTPFLGQRLAVGPIDGDGKPDIAVLSNATVTRDGATISSLQVAINEVNFADGANVTDVTDDLTAIAASDIAFFKGDAIAIGSPGYPDGNGYGAIAIAKSDPTGLSGAQSALRLIRFKVPIEEDDAADFEVITGGSLPAASATDRFHASAISFVDVDEDGDAELVTVARTAPGGNGNALRIFRNEVSGVTSGVFRQSLAGLITPLVTASNHFEGDALAIGDLDGDGAVEFVVTRATTSGATAPHTRAVSVDK